MTPVYRHRTDTDSLELESFFCFLFLLIYPPYAFPPAVSSPLNAEVTSLLFYPGAMLDTPIGSYVTDFPFFPFGVLYEFVLPLPPTTPFPIPVPVY